MTPTMSFPRSLSRTAIREQGIQFVTLICPVGGDGTPPNMFSNPPECIAGFIVSQNRSSVYIGTTKNENGLSFSEVLERELSCRGNDFPCPTLRSFVVPVSSTGQALREYWRNGLLQDDKKGYFHINCHPEKQDLLK